MNSLLNAWSWKDYFEGKPGAEILKKAFSVIEIVLWVVVAVVGVLGAIYAVYLGIKLARAEDQGKRDEAKKHLITVLVAVAVTLLLILFFNIFLPAIISAFEGVKSGDDIGSNDDNTTTMIKPLVAMIKSRL